MTDSIRRARPIIAALLTVATIGRSPLVVSADDVPVPQCTGPLSQPNKCHHGSICHPGPSDYGNLLTPFSDTIPFLSEVEIEGEHCECSDKMHTDGQMEPKGHTGVNCEHKYEICSPKHSGFACFHGSSCYKLKGEDHKYACDCSTAKWYGRHEHFVGQQCEYGGPKEKDLEYCRYGAEEYELEEYEDEWFCLNGGKCRDSKNINKKCKCPPTHQGPHCEYQSTNDDAPKVEDCTMQCSNGGQCKHGLKDYGKHAEQAEQDLDDPNNIEDPGGLATILENLGRHDNLMHCVCPKGYTGLRCDIEVQECKDGDDDPFFCYNGSKCAKETLEDGTKHHYCDCSHAHLAEDSYAGEYCQYKSTAFCDPVKGMKEKLAFCVNYGICPTDKHETCHCPPGFTGHQCEKRGFEPPPCNLECKNGGICRTGTKDYGHIGDKFDLPFHEKAHLNFEHCSCPEGYTGVDCSIEMEICGDMEHVCTHGSKCVIGPSGRYECDCTGAEFKNKPVAGFYCENHAEDVCVKGGATGDSFCTNGGKCVGIVSPSDPHPGCLCDNEFSGPHCEFSKSLALSNQGTYSGGEPETTEKSRKAAILFSFMVIIIGCIAFVAVLAVRRYDKEMDTGDSQADGFNAAGSGQLAHTESSEDGELTDVEII